MKTIKELRILPPIAISRLGIATQPLEAYTLAVSDEKPLDYRAIIPLPSLAINEEGIASTFEVNEIVFRTGEGIKPVAPFLELFYMPEGGDNLYPLTLAVLREHGYDVSPDNLHEYINWHIDLANHKIFRRTQDENDKIECAIKGINTYERIPLNGTCNNFIDNKSISFGSFQMLQPTSETEVIRVRYTPAHGKVYRSNKPLGAKEKKGGLEVIEAIYDAQKGTWAGYSDGNSTVPTTNPAYIYYGEGNNWNSLGYFDDACDGFVYATLLPPDGSKEHLLTAKGHLVAGPPDFAPDSLPVRVVIDELEQILLGTEADNPKITEVEEIVRRSFETVRLMNTSIMNGNKVDGKESGASNMVRQDTNDTQRLYQPIMATSIVDNLALLALHERVYNGLGAGKSAWFGELLRMPEEIGDLSDEGRRKMPALMRGADARALTLTRRQIDTVYKAGEEMRFDQPLSKKAFGIHKNDAISQLLYQAEGNPYSVLPRSSISNCFPGLEYDFRNLWRRSFKEIVLVENTNIVLEDNRAAADQNPDLKFRFLVWVHQKNTMVAGTGPVLPNSSSIPLPSSSNNALFMEWSNNLATIIAAAQKSKEPFLVDAYFTKEKYNESNIAPIYIPEEKDLDKLVAEGKLFKATLTVQQFFLPESTEYNPHLIQPGEMTQGLCAPWQNDFIECACYYWAASRPDYVNVEADENGASKGDNWISKERTGTYPPSANIGENPALLTYEDLFKDWQNELKFIIQGKDETFPTDDQGDSSTPT